MKLDPKVERILEWRESFSSLPDDYFFDIIHMYLGEIKTPYNKPKLIEELSTILRKKENREVLVSYLDETDIKVLTAIRFIPDVEINKLEKFFVPAMTQGDLYEEMASLEERLIIYNRENKITGKKTIAINPHLEEELESVLDLGNLIAEEKPQIENFPSAGTMGIRLSPQVIAVFISYILAHPDFSKANGDLKKKADAELKEICGIESTEIFKRLFTGMRNLVLLREVDDGKMWEVDWERLEAFFALPFKSQVVYLCVASSALLSRRALVSNATFFSNTLDFARGKYFTKEKLFAISFLIKEKSGTEDFGSRRFSKILSGGDETDDHAGSSAIEAMIDSAVVFGIMTLSGKNSEGSSLIHVEENFIDENVQEVKRLLSIDTGFSVTIMPGLSTLEFSSLVKFLDARQCDVTSTFEINRQSVIRGFDFGLSKEDIKSLLERYSAFEIPRNLEISLDEWSATYNSASIYRGYVLKLSEENAFRAENNPLFKTHMKEILAPGVYLLDFMSDVEAYAAIQKTGIDFAGKIRSVRTDVEVPPLPAVVDRGRSKISLGETSAVSSGLECNRKNKEKRLKILEDFRNALEEMETTRDQKDGLLDRISRRIIIEGEQLRPESVRFELREAFGMNYTGKINVLESSIQKNSLVEIELTGSSNMIFGIPKGILKNSETPVVFLTVENKETKETEETEIEIAKISRVKRIRNSLSLRKR